MLPPHPQFPEPPNLSTYLPSPHPNLLVYLPCCHCPKVYPMPKFLNISPNRVHVPLSHTHCFTENLVASSKLPGVVSLRDGVELSV